MKVYGYGDNRVGKKIRTPMKLKKSLDPKTTVYRINNEDFCRQLKSR